MNRLNRCALSSAILVLAGCGGSQPPIGVPSARSQPGAITTTASKGGSWMLPEAKGEDLLYSGQSPLYVFAYPSGKSVGSLNGVASNGLCSDKSGNVFATGQYGSSITEYAHGGSQPIAHLSIPNGEGGAVFSCAVDPTTGNLAATFECAVPSKCASSHEIAIFANARGTPVEYGGSNLPEFLYCGYDSAGNLFADGLFAGSSSILAELPAGSSQLRNINLVDNIKKLGQVQWDGKYITIQDQLSATLYRLQISGSTANVVGTVTFDETGAAQQSWIQGGKIVMPYQRTGKGPPTIGFWKYPAGGPSTMTISKKWGREKFTGTTVSVLPKKLRLIRN